MKTDLKVKAIIEEMCNNGSLPAMYENVHDITKLTKESSTGARDLATVIMRDCGLSSHMLATANSAFYSPKYPIKTISAAIIFLGFEKVQTLALGLSIFKNNVKSAQSQNLIKLYATSYFSGSLAMALAKERKYENPEEIFVAGLLYRLPWLALASTYPRRALVAEKMIAEENLDYNKVCEKVFEVKYDDICEAIHELYKIPGKISSILNPDASPEDSDLISLVKESDSLANMMFGYKKGGKLAISAAEGRILTLLKRREFSVSNFIRETCEKDTNIEMFFNLKNEDVNMMVNILEWGKASPAQVISNLALGQSLKREKSPAEDPESLIGHFLTELAMCRKNGNDINEILALAQEVLYRCFADAEIFTAFLGKDRKQITGKHYTGTDLIVKPEQFMVSMEHVESPLVVSMSECRGGEWKLGDGPLLLPPVLLQRLRIKAAVFEPIRMGEEALGMYFVARKTNTPFTQREQTWLEEITSHVTKAFEATRGK